VRRDLSAVAVVIAVFFVESIGKGKIIADDEIQIAESIDHLGRVGQRHVPRALVSLNIEMLMPRVERRREKAAFLPLEDLLFAAFVPDGGRSSAFENVNQLLEQIALRLALAPRRDRADISAARATGADELNE
jgi:hypothetical protein